MVRFFIKGEWGYVPKTRMCIYTYEGYRKIRFFL
ncbi:hypothetical protein BASH2_04729 [Bacillus anthracis]|nr:hypothetical protein BASH2_04729 [Bacillus anthracis]